ncbi:TRAP transporter substrate-binding protein DctP [Frigidibacter sp. MR17.24]|uniref:TRAP transporter substrate-binding protein DctP n=1 Tax=Frigidibacter sp. MR17.24 TaxID=3127345 RepID=UPI00301313F7
MNLKMLAASAAAVALFAIPAAATDLRMLSSWSSNQSYTINVAQPLIDKISELSGGEIRIGLSGPEVVPAFEQLEPVQAGVFDLLFTHPAYHIGAASLGLAVEAMRADPALRRSSGVLDTLDEYYQTLGLKLIAVAPVGSVAFNFILKQPIGDAPALAGRKIRGTQTYNPVIEGVGGAPVILPMTDIYSSLQTGVIDGAGTTLTGIADAKWYEVAKYLSRPKFGTVGLFVFMNLDTWDSLTETEQSTIHEAALAIESESIPRFDKLAAEEETFLLEHGMELSEMPAADAERLETLFSEGAWATAHITGGDYADKMHDQGEKAGLLQ